MPPGHRPADRCSNDRTTDDDDGDANRSVEQGDRESTTSAALDRRDVLGTGTVAAGALLGGCIGGSESSGTASVDERHPGFRSLEREVADRSLPVEGTFPSWLEGTLLRTGPAKFEVGDRHLRHWFDGFAMLHRFAIDDGAVTYSNRFLETRAYEHATDEGELGYREFATDPCRRIWERFFTLFSDTTTDNANVSVATHADRFRAMTETPIPVEFDPETLETLGVVADGTDLGDLTTAHPHRDDGETINYVTDLSQTSEYRVFRMPDGEHERDVFATVSRDRPAYMHSFGLTDRYVILVEFPFVVDPLEFLVRDRPFIENYEWVPDRGTRFLVIERATGEVVSTHKTDAFFAFHHVNAFEDGDDLVVDVVAYDDASIVEDLYLEAIRSEGYSPDGGRLDRFRLGETVSRETLYEGPIELPGINYDRVNAEPYRYAYGVGNRENPPRDVPNTLVKVDVETGAASEWEESGTYAGEPVFVESPDATAEDDGVILSVVLDAAAERSFLLVLDAGTFEELARAPAPHHIPLGFHGIFADL
ncbi:carotenoid oxygenase family protein [Haloterrigena salifodinae]|uniref:Carotenoid oxygenase family protein n=1 Tax=Haloterrigena salifodinae TaxID=2675099 RepID=A0A8T8DY51_9EURY|nr:carotenoid oxygenase family protein [Haloterrigena salifodinae]QRV14272.1 carotenoid oxygenase family protein [Haloterrigena salifodinae]